MSLVPVSLVSLVGPDLTSLTSLASLDNLILPINQLKINWKSFSTHTTLPMFIKRFLWTLSSICNSSDLLNSISGSNDRIPEPMRF